MNGPALVQNHPKSHQHFNTKTASKDSRYFPLYNMYYNFCEPLVHSDDYYAIKYKPGVIIDAQFQKQNVGQVVAAVTFEQRPTLPAHHTVKLCRFPSLFSISSVFQVYLFKQPHMDHEYN